MANQKTLLLIIAALIVGLVVGFLLGKGSGTGPSGVSDQSRIQKLQAQIDQAKKFFPPLPQDVRSVSGTVKEVRANVMMLDVSSANPFDESPRVRTIAITKETKVVKNEPKDLGTYQRELAEFQKTLQSHKNGAAPLSPPLPFSKIPGSLSDIRIGQQIRVTAHENIRDKDSFEAAEVSIMAIPSVQPVAPVK